MQDPGHSSLGSGGEVYAGGCVVVGAGLRVVGRGLWVTNVLVLSQQIEPLLQVVVLDITTERNNYIQLIVYRNWKSKLPAGFSQKAAIMFSIQNPGHLGSGG